MSGSCQTCKQVADGAQNESVSFGAKFRYSARHNEQHNERKKQRRRTKHGNDDCQGVQHDSHRIFGRPRFYIGRFGSRVNQLLCFNRFKKGTVFAVKCIVCGVLSGKIHKCKNSGAQVSCAKEFLCVVIFCVFGWAVSVLNIARYSSNSTNAVHIFLTVSTASEFLKNLKKARQNLPCLSLGGSGDL